MSTEQEGFELEFINPKKGNRKSTYQYIAVITAVFLFFFMFYSGENESHETVFEVFNVPLWGYAVGGLVSLIAAIYGAWSMSRNHYLLGHIKFFNDRIIVREKGADIECKLTELSFLDLRLIFSDSLTEYDTRHFQISWIFEHRDYKFDLAVPNHVERKLIRFVKENGQVLQPLKW